MHTFLTAKPNHTVHFDEYLENVHSGDLLTHIDFEEIQRDLSELERKS